ncbi:MAG TPA: hypothetical protein VG076_04635, partial [Acidimicrobiales bacterium]|nr:hypothetical protein [Acidimicrobiales bacterium]
MIYVYPSMAHALKGEKAGGTGFLVSMESALPGYQFFYAVTNSHVAVNAGAVRLNLRNGGAS